MQCKTTVMVVDRFKQLPEFVQSHMPSLAGNSLSDVLQKRRPPLLSGTERRRPGSLANETGLNSGSEPIREFRARTHCTPVSCNLGALALPGKRLMRRAASSLGAALLDIPGFGALALRMQADTGRRMHHRPIAYRSDACTKWSRRQRHRGTAGPVHIGLK